MEIDACAIKHCRPRQVGGGGSKEENDFIHMILEQEDVKVVIYLMGSR